MRGISHAGRCSDTIAGRLESQTPKGMRGISHSPAPTIGTKEPKSLKPPRGCAVFPTCTRGSCTVSNPQGDARYFPPNSLCLLELLQVFCLKPQRGCAVFPTLALYCDSFLQHTVSNPKGDKRYFPLKNLLLSRERSSVSNPKGDKRYFPLGEDPTTWSNSI